MRKPELGDQRIREGFLETYEMVPCRGFWSGDPEPDWVRGKLVDGAHAVELYSKEISWRGHVTLGLYERIVSVSNIGGGSQLVWIAQDSALTADDLKSGSKGES